MNRRERRAIEKSYGLQKIKKSLNLNERMELVRQNLKDSKEKTKNKPKQQKYTEAEVSSLATELAISEQLTYIDAIEKARTILEEKTK